MTTADGATPSFTLLVVCTGNICRSPAAERLFAATLGPVVKCESAGTHALVGEPIANPLITHLRSAHARFDTFAARQLTKQLIRDADLLLPMTRNHRAAAVELWPGAVRRSFTLREFSRLLLLIDVKELPRGDAAARLSAAIPLAAAQRRQISENPEVDDVADPYRRTDEHYAAAFHQIQDAVDTIADVIVPGRGPTAVGERLRHRLGPSNEGEPLTAIQAV